MGIQISNFIILPLIGMFIGLLTNWLAVKLLFWPKNKVMGIQGAIPKRKNEIADKIADSFMNVLPKNLEKISNLPFIGENFKLKMKKGVSKKIKGMGNDQIQELVEKTSKKELRFIKISGGAIGLIIGFIQAGVLEII